MQMRAKGKMVLQAIKEIPPLERDELKQTQTLWLRNVQERAFPNLFTKKLARAILPKL